MTPNMMQVRMAAISKNIPQKRDKFRIGFVAGAAWMKLMMTKSLNSKMKTAGWRNININKDSNLTPMEYLIYQKLRHNGSISHEEISEFSGCTGISKSTRIHISNIRKKTGAEIVNVRGFGYKINKP